MGLVWTVGALGVAEPGWARASDNPTAQQHATCASQTGTVANHRIPPDLTPIRPAGSRQRVTVTTTSCLFVIALSVALATSL
jgi:hypothetical protein